MSWPQAAEYSMIQTKKTSAAFIRFTDICGAAMEMAISTRCVVLYSKKAISVVDFFDVFRFLMELENVIFVSL
jgi:hypothetical protein